MNDITKFISGFLGFILSWFITTVVLYGGWKLLGPDFNLWAATGIWLVLLIFGRYANNKKQ
jgi:hypothetical protein